MNPLSSKPAERGRRGVQEPPAASAVPSAMAFARWIPSASASSNHRRNWTMGSALEVVRFEREMGLSLMPRAYQYSRPAADRVRRASRLLTGDGAEGAVEDGVRVPEVRFPDLFTERVGPRSLRGLDAECEERDDLAP